MQGKYRKIMVVMRQESPAYLFWKKETAEPVCYVESYKEKRAVFFRGYNLLPGESYRFILIGNAGGEIEHRDFGPLHTGADGELQCYETFDGAPLENYAFCLLCAEKGNGELEIIYKGILFPEETDWALLCEQASRIEAFTAGCDETGARWFRMEAYEKLPSWTACCIPWIRPYGHCIIGKKGTRWYFGVPGRFLQKEQPLREEGCFLLWQPMRGGESFFERPDQMTREQQEQIFGYWIAEADIERGRFQAI